MSANVRCAGGGWWEQHTGTLPNGRIRYRDSNDPCGWEGDRHAHLVPSRKGRWGDPTLAPCPRCRGRVELIPQEP